MSPWRFSCLLAFALAVRPAVSASSDSAGSRFFAAVDQQFAALDRNADGTLAPAEIDSAVSRTDLDDRTAAAVAALKRASRSKNYQLPQLTLAGLQVLATNSPATNRPNFGRMFVEGLRRLTNNPSTELFASGTPRLDTIRQGKMGNCFTLAPLGALVHRDPQQVAAMFQTEADGRFRVRLAEREFVVPPPTPAERAMMAANEGNGFWVNVYETAVGLAQAESKPPEKRRATPLDEIASGGSAGAILELITGHAIERFSFKFARDEAVLPAAREEKLAALRAKLSAARAHRQAMTAGTAKPTTPGIRGNHAYALLDYDASTDTVRVWDPHGDEFKPKGVPGSQHGYPRKDGQYELPLTEFVRQFSGMAFELPPANKGS